MYTSQRHAMGAAVNARGCAPSGWHEACIQTREYLSQLWYLYQRQRLCLMQRSVFQAEVLLHAEVLLQAGKTARR